MYYLFYLGRVLALLIPRRVCYFLAKVIALIYYNFSRSDRKAVLSNLSPIIDDEKTRIVTARKVFINFAYYLVDFFRYRKLDLSFIEKYVVISGLDNLNRCFAENKGVVLLSAHLGNYELGGAVLALLGYPFCALALPHRDKRVNRFFDNQRNLVGVEVIPTGGVSRRCLSSLRKGKIVAFLGDRDFSGKGVRTAVGNSYSFLPKGPAFFSFKTGAYILPVFFVRENKYCYHLIIEKPFEAASDNQDAVLANQAEVIGKYIKRYPEQWYMFQQYWIKS